MWQREVYHLWAAAEICSGVDNPMGIAKNITETPLVFIFYFSGLSPQVRIIIRCLSPVGLLVFFPFNQGFVMVVLVFPWALTLEQPNMVHLPCSGLRAVSSTWRLVVSSKSCERSSQVSSARSPLRPSTTRSQCPSSSKWCTKSRKRAC